MKITEEKLKRLEACSSDIQKFREAFPNGCFFRTKEEAVRLAVSNPSLNYGWAAGNLLKAPAWAVYQEVKASAEAAYKEARAKAFAEEYWEQENGRR